MAKLINRKTALVLIPAIQPVGCNCQILTSGGLPYEETELRLEKKLQKVLSRSSNPQFL